MFEPTIDIDEVILVDFVLGARADLAVMPASA